MQPQVKRNYSFRLSGEVVALIDKQEGNNNTEKLENLIIKRVNESADLDKKIAAQKKEIETLGNTIADLQRIVSNMKEIERYITWAKNYAEKGIK